MRKAIVAALLSLGLLGSVAAPVDAKPMPEKITGCYSILDRRPAIDRGVWYQCKGPGSGRATIICSKRESSWSSGVTYRNYNFSVASGKMKTITMYCPSSHPHVLELNLVRYSS